MLIQKSMPGLKQGEKLTKRPTKKPPEEIRICTNFPHTAFVEIQKPTHQLQISSGRCWNQIRWEKVLQPSDQGTKGTVHTNGGRNMVDLYWPKNTLGLN